MLWITIFEIQWFVLAILIIYCEDNKLRTIKQMFGAMVFGLVLEIGTIIQTSAYSYSTHFSLLIYGVPVSVAVAWGCIIYAVMTVSDMCEANPLRKSIIDALLAAHLDIAMDPLAIRAGLWHMGLKTDEQWFGVLYGNYWGWFWVVSSFTFFFRKNSKHSHSYFDILHIVCSALMVIFITNAFFGYFLEHCRILTLLLYASALVYLCCGAKLYMRTPKNGIYLLVPVTVHL